MYSNRKIQFPTVSRLLCGAKVLHLTFFWSRKMGCSSWSLLTKTCKARSIQYFFKINANVQTHKIKKMNIVDEQNKFGQHQKPIVVFVCAIFSPFHPPSFQSLHDDHKYQEAEYESRIPYPCIKSMRTSLKLISMEKVLTKRYTNAIVNNQCNVNRIQITCLPRMILEFLESEKEAPSPPLFFIRTNSQQSTLDILDNSCVRREKQKCAPLFENFSVD